MSSGGGWGENQPQQQFGSRSYGNSNFRGGPRRGGGGGGGGGGNNEFGGGQGWGAQRTGGYNRHGGVAGGGYAGNGGGGGGYVQGGGRPYGDRQPRQNYGGGPPQQNFVIPYIPEGSPASNIEIESDKVGMVIGKKGSKIREIQSTYNVQVKIGESYSEETFFFLNSKQCVFGWCRGGILQKKNPK